MPVLPVPEVVKEMAKRIDQIAQRVSDLDRKVERFCEGLRNLRASEENVKSIGHKVDALTGSLDVARDQLSMLCATVEKVN